MTNNDWQPEVNPPRVPQRKDNGVNPQGTDPKLIDALNRASSLELFQLSTLIERMLVSVTSAPSCAGSRGGLSDIEYVAKQGEADAP